jgi:hypothetical protein
MNHILKKIEKYRTIFIASVFIRNPEKLPVKKNRIVYLLFISLILSFRYGTAADILVEAESFTHKGGWVTDQQFMDQMGSPYLMAHGLGQPVADACTTVEFPETGTYYLFVRTFNWTAPWYGKEGPGKFKLAIDNRLLPVVLGDQGEQWMWQNAGKVRIRNKQTKISLHDLTGFNGRCDALFFTTTPSCTPPNEEKSLSELRRRLLNIEIQDAGRYDLVVVGGGAAGICTAVSAARLGLKTALINDRPILGGNGSSEVRIGLTGDYDKNLYPNIGNVMKEIIMERPFNGGPAEAYNDEKKMTLVQNEKNIDLFLNRHVFKVEMQQNRITAVIAKHIENSMEQRWEGTLFADCTGDATVGFLAGADFRMGRESAYEAFESLAPLFSDHHLLGSSNLWAFETADTPRSFPALDWACRFDEKYHIAEDKPDWRWEGGFAKNTILDAENIRDQNFRAILGNWSYMKNHHPGYANRKLTWMAYIIGKRESRRLLGDIILNQNDLQNQVKYNDASFTATWPMDLHYPDPKNSRYFPGEEFFSYCVQTRIYPYHVPYRCLYSRNINNLFMAGRNISVTHVAFGSIRVQRTTAMMGEVIGMAASVCKKHNILPRQVYLEHFNDLKTLMKAGVPLR